MTMFLNRFPPSGVARRSVLKRLVIHVCSTTQAKLFKFIYQRLSPELRQAIGQLLTVAEGQQRSYFYQLKE